MLPILLPPNPIQHFSRGGDRIAELRGIVAESDHQPEEWLGSTTARFGDDRGTGLSALPDGALLRDRVAADPAAWTGGLGVQPGGGPGDVGVLVKLLDARQRLPVHVHPSRGFSLAHLDCPYGKTEAWFVLDSAGDGAVYLGWNADLDRHSEGNRGPDGPMSAAADRVAAWRRRAAATPAPSAAGRRPSGWGGAANASSGAPSRRTRGRAPRSPAPPARPPRPRGRRGGPAPRWAPPPPPTPRAPPPAPGREARPITEFAAHATQHRQTGIAELDRVLGGGVVPGAAILFSGEPGVGKSTLLLDAASRAAGSGARVLYASGEESTGQVRMRAERTGALHDTLYLASETDLATVLGHIEAVDPELIIIDSVQTMASDLVDGGPGGPAQVREVASALIRVAKGRGTPVILVGHVTKDGSVAGPRLLEHLVDVVCHFEGGRQTSLRFLRTLKNRFGPTDEIGCFEMTDRGIAEVSDPSGLFLSRSTTPVSGTCATVAMEGRRALTVEVQALVAKSSTPNPRRVTSGVDPARVAMILAVLERRAGLTTHDQDVYVSTVGGVKLTEPAADLAIALAVLSAARNRPLAHDLAAFGEISLAGEVRPITGAAQRTSEARRLGYRRILDASAGTLDEARRRAGLA